MREPQTTVIGGRRYVVAPLPSGVAIRMLTKLGKIGIPAFGSISAIASAMKTGRASLGAMLDSIGDDDLGEFSATFAKHTMVAPKADSTGEVPLAPIFETYFQGALDEWLEWFGFCMKVNFLPLMSALGAKIAAAPSVDSAAKTTGT